MDDEKDVLEFPADDDVNAVSEDEFDEAAEEAVEEEAEAEASEVASDSDDSKKIRELEDRYVRLFAEYDNFRKRTSKEKDDLYASAVVEVTKQWLSVLDNIDRALDAAKALAADEAEETEKEDKMLQGLELIKKQAQDVLAKINVTEIECERGTAFDPNLHEAVMHTEDDSLGENQIAQVFQKGYILKDRVVRHAVVQVAN
ncbi:MAG: nucleotide exchange factor GrpE [Clostridiales bacterium]|nr:nucleotide exchange factor GrpE [Clostridiales bacterium]